MFERRTVFIVGAGGSRELDFPMGAQLTTSIAERVTIKFKGGYEPVGGDNDIYRAIQQIAEMRGVRDANVFFHAGQAIARGMPQAISIDNYLHTHRDNENIITVGKLGIAATILDAERKSRIAITPESGERIKFANLKETWHNVFVKMLLENASRANLKDVFSQISIITFNYDRCIEHYLVHAVRDYLNLTKGEAESLVKRLEIIHPYGQVGKLPWQTEQGIEFGHKVYHTQLSEISEQIRTFTERLEEDDEMVTRMRLLISQAEVVVYLGFSYGDMNMELMSVPNAGERVIYGTSLGISAANKRVIEAQVASAMGPGRDAVKRIELAEMTCVDFLNAYWKPIMRGV